MHDLTLIYMLAVALGGALLLGWLTQRLGLSPLVGYLVAGVLVGPHTPGFVADRQLAAQLAEVGVVLLLFGVGLHFHPKELVRVWRVAVPGAIAQSALATMLGWLFGRAMGWGDAAGLVLGMALAVASTVVLSRMLMERHQLETREGRVAIGWLIVEDLFTVVALVVLPALATQATGLQLGVEVAAAIGKVAVFAVLCWLVGRWVLSPLLECMARERAAELFTLGVFVVALGVAALAAGAFHVSVALGAFFGGLVVGQSRVGVQAAADVAPFRDVFSALFFVSVGMLFDPRFLLDSPGVVACVLAIVLLAKPLIAWLVVRVLRHPRSVSVTVAVGLAQIGEFSFLLGGLGLSLGLLPEAAFNAIVASALISIALNPLLFMLSPRLIRWRERLAAPGVLPEATAPPEGSVVVVGFGAVGRRVCAAMLRGGLPFVVVASELREADEAAALGYRSCFGDAGRHEVLTAAGITRARLLLLTETDLALRMRTCLAARHLNAAIFIVASVRHAAERGWLEEFGVTSVVEEDRSIARELIEFIERAPR